MTAQPAPDQDHRDWCLWALTNLVAVAPEHRAELADSMRRGYARGWIDATPEDITRAETIAARAHTWTGL